MLRLLYGKIIRKKTVPLPGSIGKLMLLTLVEPGTSTQFALTPTLKELV
jgi:hypothetical protein